MAHLLLIEVPGGNDFTILEDAIDLGHQVTFFTADLAHYRKQGEETQARLALAREIVEIHPLIMPSLNDVHVLFIRRARLMRFCV
jgi:hypothetical protein